MGRAAVIAHLLIVSQKIVAADRQRIGPSVRPILPNAAAGKIDIGSQRASLRDKIYIVRARARRYGSDRMERERICSGWNKPVDVIVGLKCAEYVVPKLMVGRRTGIQSHIICRTASDMSMLIRDADSSTRFPGVTATVGIIMARTP